MQFVAHSELVGTHAFLSASNYHWIRYDDDKLQRVFLNRLDALRGDRLHALAKELILLKQKLPDTGQTLNRYVNDAIGFRMTPEQILFYSYNSYGTADAISFDEKKKLLRIHDLKTGVNRTSMDQLLVYAALFCLEYDYKPQELEFILRIYQNDDVEEWMPDFTDILPIIDRLVTADRLLEELKAEVLS